MFSIGLCLLSHAVTEKKFAIAVAALDGRGGDADHVEAQGRDERVEFAADVAAHAVVPHDALADMRRPGLELRLDQNREGSFRRQQGRPAARDGAR